LFAVLSVRVAQSKLSAVRTAKGFSTRTGETPETMGQKLAKVPSHSFPKESRTNDARLTEIALTQVGKDVIKALLTDATKTKTRLLKDVPQADFAASYRVIDHFHSVLEHGPKAKPIPNPP